MENENHFGEWLKRRRRQLDLTQQQLADCAACSVVTIRKFETGERRPSRDLAQLLANCLTIPADKQETFIAFARNLQPTFDPALPEENPTPLSALLSAPLHPRTLSPPLRASLPLPATPFVGREEELAQISARLADPACRLLTLVGPGGMGKTRLALAAAAGQIEHFPDGVVFVSLTAVTDPTLLPQTIAHSLNVPLTGAEKPAVQLGRILQNRRLLLVLDNFEQLLEAADLLASWLREAPAGKWLVTSRERLNLVEEWLLPVQGFGQADAGVALFVQSARRVQPDFSLNGQETAVSHICQYVGEMPLAIELAAGWTAVLNCEQILTQMQQTFDFLSTSLRNVPQRHRSLRHLFDQTWQLLPPAEQDALMKLSVFRGGFGLNEAEAVAGADLPLLLALANKSLVLGGGNGRYDLHELTRHYAAEKLRESRVETAVRQRHFQTFLALAEAFEEHRAGPDAIAWFQRVAEDLDNFRAALSWALRERPDEAMLRLVDCLWWFWFRRAYWQEAEHWFAAVVAQTTKDDSPQRCRVLLYLSTIIALQGRYDEAAPFLLEARAMAQRLEDPESMALVLVVLAQATPDSAQSIAAYVEAQTLLAQIQSPPEVPPQVPPQDRKQALIYNLLGERLHENGRHDEAADNYQHSLALYRQMGNVDLITHPLGNLGRLALHNGRLAEAQDLINEAVTLSRAIGNRQSVADWLIPLAKLSFYKGDMASAGDCLQEALDLYREMGNQRGHADTLACLALAELAQGNTSRADQYVRNSLALYRKSWQSGQAVNLALSDEPDHIVPDFVDAFFVAGLVNAAQEQFEQAAVCLAVAGRLQQQIGHQPISFLQQRIEAAETAVRQNLSPPAYQRAQAAGQNWSLDEVFSFTLS